MKRRTEQTIFGLMLKTWGYISADALELYPKGVPRDSVVELVLDAQRMEMFADTPDEKKALVLFRDEFLWEEQIKFAKKVFTAEFYSA